MFQDLNQNIVKLSDATKLPGAGTGYYLLLKRGKEVSRVDREAKLAVPTLEPQENRPGCHDELVRYYGVQRGRGIGKTGGFKYKAEDTSRGVVEVELSELLAVT